MAKKHKRQGRFCWCCGRMRPNEQFSGSGHARHLCKDCSKLGKSELQYRQDQKNLERLVTWEGIISRKKRKAFNRFLEHPDLRIRRYAEELATEDVKARFNPSLPTPQNACISTRFGNSQDICQQAISTALRALRVRPKLQS